MRTPWLAFVIALGCGRPGLPEVDGPRAQECGAGTYASGNECLPVGAAGAPTDGGIGRDAAVARDAGGDSDLGVVLDGGATMLDLGIARDFGPLVPTPPGSAVTYQIDVAHSGGQPNSTLRPPLTRRWSMPLASTNLSYPIIVGDAVFVAGGDDQGRHTLYGLSGDTGDFLWTPITLAGHTFPTQMVSLAWDDGLLFTVDPADVVQAFDAASGTMLWSRALSGPYTLHSPGPPVAVDGVLYVAGGYETLFALDEHTGAVRWTTSPAGDPTSAAWTPNAIVLQYVTGTIGAIAPADGQRLWQDTGCCTGGGGSVPVVYGDRIYAVWDVLVPNTIYRLSDGQSLGTFVASAIPAFENALGFFRNGSTLEAHDADGNVRWTFAGDGMLDSTPIAAGGVVYIGSSSGQLYAVDEKTGTQMWSDALPAAIAPSLSDSSTTPVTGLAASLDLLVVPAGATLTAYGN